MKFYYNGKLVRTSKNHVYTHAVIDMSNGHVEGCRANKEAAESIISSEISRVSNSIQNHESALKAIEQGKTMYRVKEGRRSYWMPIRTTGEDFKHCIEWCENHIKEVERNWKVVELEAR